MSGGITIPGFDHQLHAKDDIALYIGLSLSIISFIAFLMSCAHDEVGICDRWSFIAGDILMYFALAYTVTGFFAPLTDTLNAITADLPEQAAQFALFKNMILLLGAAAWFLAIYGGPIVTFLRSPFPRKTNIRLAVAYVVLLLTLSWVNSQAFILEAQDADQKRTLAIEFLKELIQPVKW